MGLFSKLTSFVSTNSGQALHDAVEACRFESLEERQLLSLMVDLRLAGGGTTVNVTGEDQIINMELWATSTGSNGTGSDDGFQMLLGSLMSGDSGSVKGDLSVKLLDPFTGLSSSEGDRTDLDGDGDLDIGSNDNSTSEGYFIARSGGMTYSGGSVSVNSNSFKIADVKFTVTSVGSGGDVKITFVPRGGPNGTAIWAEEHSIRNDLGHPGFGVGSAVTLRAPSTGVDAGVSNGLLTVRGTKAANNMKVTLSGDNLVAEVDGETKSFPASSVSKIRVLGLDGHDTILIGSTVNLPARLDGGAGNDKLTGSSGKDTLYGGDGKDNLKALAGNDFLDGGFGADKISGGKGTDIASYKTRKNAVRVSIDDSANDGEGKEGDNVRYDIENVYGGAGNDKLVGSTDDNYFRGYAGNDIIMGGEGNDTLDGGKGTDKLSGEDGNDRLFARDGARDSVYGGAGKDRAKLDKTDVRKTIETLLA